MTCAAIDTTTDPENLSIECSLIPMSEYSIDSSPKTKFGRYHKTNFWDIKGYGSKKWVVAVRIKVHDPALAETLSDAELFAGCLNYLNTPPPRKKYAKKDPQPIYGVLSPYKSKKNSTEDVVTLSSLVIVERPKNRLFWGKGKSV